MRFEEVISFSEGIGANSTTASLSAAGRASFLNLRSSSLAPQKQRAIFLFSMRETQCARSDSSSSRFSLDGSRSVSPGGRYFDLINAEQSLVRSV